MMLWEVGRFCSVACTQCQMKCLKHKTVGFSISNKYVYCITVYPEFLRHVIFTDFAVERATVKIYHHPYLACKHVCEIWKLQWQDTLIHEI